MPNTLPNTMFGKFWFTSRSRLFPRARLRAPQGGGGRRAGGRDLPRDARPAVHRQHRLRPGAGGLSLGRRDPRRPGQPRGPGGDQPGGGAGRQGLDRRRHRAARRRRPRLRPGQSGPATSAPWARTTGRCSRPGGAAPCSPAARWSRARCRPRPRPPRSSPASRSRRRSSTSTAWRSSPARGSSSTAPITRATWSATPARRTARPTRPTSPSRASPGASPRPASATCSSGSAPTWAPRRSSRPAATCWARSAASVRRGGAGLRLAGPGHRGPGAMPPLRPSPDAVDVPHDRRPRARAPRHDARRDRHPALGRPLRPRRLERRSTNFPGDRASVLGTLEALT